MRIRRNYWFVPALAILGIILAALHFISKSQVREETLVLDPNEPVPPLPAAAPAEAPAPESHEPKDNLAEPTPVTSDSPAVAPEPPANTPAP